MLDHNRILSEGTWIENFEIRKKLGRGGFGVTYQAKEFHRSSSEEKHELRLVALKEFFPRDLSYRIADSRVVPVNADGEERPDLAFFSAMKAFIREAQAVMRVEHPNVVQIYQVFESHGTAYFAMPLLHGLSLHGRLRQVGTLSQDEIERVVLPLLDGIEAVHKEGIIHRDIKPDNIMIRESVNDAVSRPVLIDFGAARITAVDDTRQYSRRIYPGTTGPSMICLTPGYAPPEQYSQSSGTNKPSPYNDVYAFCATLYRCVTGKTPPDATERSFDIQCRKPDPLLSASRARSGEQSYSAALLASIDWGLELDPANRPQSVEQLREVLLGKAPIPERAVTQITMPRSPSPARTSSVEPEIAVLAPQPLQGAHIPAPGAIAKSPLQAAPQDTQPLIKSKPEAVDAHFLNDARPVIESGADPHALQTVLAVGKVIADRFEIIRVIGQGGLGIVYEANDLIRRQSVALKFLRAELVANDTAKQRFLNDVSISIALSHDNIVSVFDVTRYNDSFFLTMELLQGQSLRQLLQVLAADGKKMPLAQAVGIAMDVSLALEYAHRSTLHRDIKPENVWILQNGKAKLMDFGIASLQDQTSDLAKTSPVQGTAHYMAPEQLIGTGQIDHRADQYALGIVLYEMLTGSLPIGRIDAVSRRRPGVSQNLDELVAKTLSGRAEERFADDAALLKALNALPTAESKPGASNKFALAMGGLLLVAGLGYGAFEWAKGHRYEINGDTVYDRTTKLTWQRCSVGQRWMETGCDGIANEFTFDDAQKQGNGTWRVPTKDELETLIVKTQNYAIDERAFPASTYLYWTSTPDDASRGWYVFFLGGHSNVGVRSVTYAVRLVRKTDKAENAAVTRVANARYVITGDTVYDKTTNLTWQRCSVGQRWQEPASCVGEARQLTFDEARKTGNGKWRVPTKDELITLIDDAQKPAIDGVSFPNTQVWYWTSTKSEDASLARYVNFNGSVGDYSGYLSSTNSVRLVRSGLFLAPINN